MDKDANCGNCTFWENRPEMQMDMNTGFCTIKDNFMNRRSHCSRYCRRGKAEMTALLDGGAFSMDDEVLDPFDPEA